MLFQKRQDFSEYTGKALGDTFEHEISREFPIEKIVIRVTGTVGTAMTGPLADKLQGILNRATLTVADGARTRTVVDCSGAGLLEYAVQVHGLDSATKIYLETNATGAFEFNYPIHFCLPCAADPLYSATILPVNRYNNNPKLKLKIASVAEMCASGLVLTGTLTIQVITFRRQVTVTDWPTWDTELSEFYNTTFSGAQRANIELPIPGAYTGLLIRGYTSTTARGDVLSATGEARLDLLGTTLRRFKLQHLLNENQASIPWAEADTVIPGSYFLDFLTDNAGPDASDLGSVFQTSGLQTTGARPNLVMDIGGAYTVKLLAHRIFGDLSPLIRGR